MWTKKIKCLLLFLVFCSLHCYAQEEQQFTTRINTTDLWNKIEWNLSSLETEQNNMKTLIDRQEKQIASLESAYQNQLQLYLNLDIKYQKSEQDMKKWRTCSVVLGSMTITFGLTTIALLLMMRGK